MPIKKKTDSGARYQNIAGYDLRLPDPTGKVITIKVDEIVVGDYWGRFPYRLRLVQES